MPALHDLAHPEGLGSDPKNKEKVRGGGVGAKDRRVRGAVDEGGLEENSVTEYGNAEYFR
ncbi:unnamed protein product [marine sediment metagenome]|uniref:Uncharacterized protein n=1 Tax=marine sediment metagenome TaxID=412755 RepID=X1KPP2_9ZZZZ